jgi:hypothetical protein
MLAGSVGSTCQRSRRLGQNCVRGFWKLFATVYSMRQTRSPLRMCTGTMSPPSSPLLLPASMCVLPASAALRDLAQRPSPCPTCPAPPCDRLRILSASPPDRRRGLTIIFGTIADYP